MCGLGLGFWVEDIGAMGHAARLEFKAQMGLGISVPYISHPLIRAQVLRRIKESKMHPHLRRSMGESFGGFRSPLMRSQKARCSEPFGLAIIIT